VHSHIIKKKRVNGCGGSGVFFHLLLKYVSATLQSLSHHVGRLGVEHGSLSSGRCGKDYSITKIYNRIDLSNCRIMSVNTGKL